MKIRIPSSESRLHLSSLFLYHGVSIRSASQNTGSTKSLSASEIFAHYFYLQLLLLQCSVTPRDDWKMKGGNSAAEDCSSSSCRTLFSLSFFFLRSSEILHLVLLTSKDDMLSLLISYLVPEFLLMRLKERC